MSLRLSRVDADGVDAVFRIADAARDADGADPFNERSRHDAAAGRHEALLIIADTESGDAGSASGEGAIVGAAILGSEELDLVIRPDRRGEGFGSAALTRLLPRFAGPVSAWAHGDHPAARALAERHGFDRVRTLLQLEAQLDTEGAGPERPAASDGIRIDAFRAGTDDAEWVALNARVFAAHPEQGGVTLGDLRDRMSEAWFDAGDFLVARDDSGRMVGYNWLKIERGTDAAGRDIRHGSAPAGFEGSAGLEGSAEREGEIYVVGVDSTSAGRGLGRALMTTGLRRLRERGCTVATLYVEGDNGPALGLYRSFGFTDRSVDVQYRRG